MVRLDVLPEPQAVGLVREVLGAARTLAEEEARELAQACGWLPLALRAAAGFLLRRQAWSMAEYLAELRDRGSAALDKVETVLGLSLDRLAEKDGELARRFALLGAFPAGFDAAAAAEVWGGTSRGRHATASTRWPTGAWSRSRASAATACTTWSATSR